MSLPTHLLAETGSAESAPHHGLAEQLVDYLLLRTSLDDVARFAVHHLLDRLHIWHMSIYTCAPDGSLALVGSIGLLPDARTISLENRNCFTDPAFANSLRIGETQSTFPLPGWSEHDSRLMAREQLAEGPAPLWPLAIPARTIGVLQMSFLHVPDAHQVAKDITEIGPVLTLLTMHACPPEEFDDSRRAHSTVAEIGEIPARLTARQIRILELMAEGMTNDQIAHSIRFSASTVRQETMTLYRFLGVAGRIEAVVEARKRGLLPVRPGESVHPSH